MAQNISIPDYLTMHLAAQKLMQIDNIAPYLAYVAEDGLFYIIVKSDWDSDLFDIH